MSEDMARALGARGPEPIIIDGKEYFPRPLNVKDLAEVQRECLKYYRKAYLEAQKDVAETIDDPIERRQFMDQKRAEAGSFDLGTLPKRFVYDGKSVPVTDKLKKWLLENLEVEFPPGPDCETKYHRAVSIALDSGDLTEQEVEQLTGKKIRKVKTPYVNWWIGGCIDGMLAMVHQAFKDQGLRIDQIKFSMMNDGSMLAQIAREIEHLTAPETGNG